MNCVWRIFCRTLPRHPVEHAHSFPSSLSPENLPGSQTLPLKSSLKKAGTNTAGRHGGENGGVVGNSMEELRV